VSDFSSGSLKQTLPKALRQIGQEADSKLSLNEFNLSVKVQRLGLGALALRAIRSQEICSVQGESWGQVFSFSVSSASG
jgi:hypothetical protein